MARKVAIGEQDFAGTREKNVFYVDKTYFIKDWWDAKDDVTLLCRPRRFGKTLTLSMLEAFFSNRFAHRSDLFEGLLVWEDEDMRKLQGSYPVINLTFSDSKERTFEEAVAGIKRTCEEEYRRWARVLYRKEMYPADYELLQRRGANIERGEVSSCIRQLAGILDNYYGKQVIILLDEYDTPLLEAYNYGYWDEMAGFMRGFLNAAFKSNPYLERALLTGITRVAHENMFSDFNNPCIVTISTEQYETALGFTEEEVFAAMEEQGIPTGQREEVREWYDGFTFGSQTDMYNPWSIVNFLRAKKCMPYWSNTSSNGLVAKLLHPRNETLRSRFENLLRGESITVTMNESLTFPELEYSEEAVWSMLYAAGYVKALSHDSVNQIYELAVTNGETHVMFHNLIQKWFATDQTSYNEFQKALLAGDAALMNRYLSEVLINDVSFYDGGAEPSDKEPERFYHGLVLGMIVGLGDRYEVTLNRESGYGRYDIMLRPRDATKDLGIIIEFKVQDENKGEKTLADTVQAGLAQIEEKKYEASLRSAGVPQEHIRKYSFAFKGKDVLIG